MSSSCETSTDFTRSIMYSSVLLLHARVKTKTFEDTHHSLMWHIRFLSVWSAQATFVSRSCQNFWLILTSNSASESAKWVLPDANLQNIFSTGVSYSYISLLLSITIFTLWCVTWKSASKESLVIHVAESFSDSWHGQNWPITIPPSLRWHLHGPDEHEEAVDVCLLFV